MEEIRIEVEDREYNAYLCPTISQFKDLWDGTKTYATLLLDHTVHLNVGDNILFTEHVRINGSGTHRPTGKAILVSIRHITKFNYGEKNVMNVFGFFRIKKIDFNYEHLTDRSRGHKPKG
jgi:hypothetical protein